MIFNSLESIFIKTYVFIVYEDRKKEYEMDWMDSIHCIDFCTQSPTPRDHEA
jgi:hypothetical protein